MPKNTEQKIVGVKISIEVINSLFSYLQQQPYNQVAELISKLQKSEPIMEEPVVEP